MTDYSDVVLVEDNYHDIEMIKDALNDTGEKISIWVFRDGADAAQFFFNPESSFRSNNAHPPGLILLDLKIPKISGLELLKRLKSDEKTKNIPVVIFTSSNEASDRRAGYQYGANSYLVKPLDADIFSDHIRKIINYWIIMNQNAT